MKKKVFPKIAEMFPAVFPKNWRPWVDGWSFTVNELKNRLPDGTFQLLTLDISISDEEYVQIVNNGSKKDLSQRAEENYKCEVSCKHCFECKTDTNNPLMTFAQIQEVILEAKKLGLQSVKFLGPGELLHNPKLFEILDFFESQKIKIGIFTKGVIIGDNKLSQKIFKISARALCHRLASYSAVRMLVGFTSADPETEDNRLQTSIINFSKKRNQGIENLVAEGLNSNPNCQKLSMICAPILKDNIDEVLEIVKWGTRRNIPVVTTPTMVSGKGLEMHEIQDKEFKNIHLINLFVKIYFWFIKQGIMTKKQIAKDGVSPYPGFACNQFISGMFIRKDGRIQACPGNETGTFRYANDIRKTNLKTVWKNSLGYAIRKKLVESGKVSLTQPCYAKTEGELVSRGSIPENFYRQVLEKL